MRVQTLKKPVLGFGLAALMIAAFVPAAAARSVVVPPSQSSGTIVGIAAGNPSFSTLVAAVGCADPAVAATLTSGAQYTVFAPTNSAFAALGLNASNVCTALPTDTLTKILLYHVEEGRHFSNSVLPRHDGQMKRIGTLLGQSFAVDSTGRIETTSGATSPTIVAANIAATNGVIHVVDAVLIPKL